MLELLVAEELKGEILSNCDIGQWDIQEVIKIIDSCPKITKLEVKDNDIVICKFNHDLDYDDMQSSMYKIRDIVGSDKIIAITDDLEVYSQPLEETIVMLENLLKQIMRDMKSDCIGDNQNEADN